MSADAVDSGLVRLFEMWTSQRISRPTWNASDLRLQPRVACPFWLAT